MPIAPRDDDGTVVRLCSALFQYSKEIELKKKPLFNESENWTEPGHQLAHEARDALQPIVDKWVAEGYRTRDIESVLNAEVAELLVMSRLLAVENKLKLNLDSTLANLPIPSYRPGLDHRIDYDE